MEPYNQEESINSSEERVDDQQNDRGVGRSYECVFCKRGFNTAQALGGHMNIHRKDRAKNKPTSKDYSHKQEENHYSGPRFYQQILPASTYQSENYSLSYATYNPESSNSIRSHEKHKPENPLMNDDWRLSLSLDLEKISHDEKEELDLELRLGYDS